MAFYFSKRVKNNNNKIPCCCSLDVPPPHPNGTIHVWPFPVLTPLACRLCWTKSHGVEPTSQQPPKTYESQKISFVQKYLFGLLLEVVSLHAISLPVLAGKPFFPCETSLTMLSLLLSYLKALSCLPSWPQGSPLQ